MVCTEDTLAAVEKARRHDASKNPLWRVSSTVFSQIASDEILRPLGHFATPQALAAYPAMASGEYVERELEAINLRAPSVA